MSIHIPFTTRAHSNSFICPGSARAHAAAEVHAGKQRRGVARIVAVLSMVVLVMANAAAHAKGTTQGTSLQGTSLQGSALRNLELRPNWPQGDYRAATLADDGMVATKSCAGNPLRAVGRSATGDSPFPSSFALTTRGGVGWFKLHKFSLENY